MFKTELPTEMLKQKTNSKITQELHHKTLTLKVIQ